MLSEQSDEQSARENARRICVAPFHLASPWDKDCRQCVNILTALTTHAAEARRVALEEAAARLERMRETQGSTIYRDPLRHGIDAIRALAAPARESESQEN